MVRFRWTIGRKLILGFGAVAVVFVAALALSAEYSSSAQSHWHETQRWNVAISGAAEQIEGVQMQMAAQALYVATSDPRYRAEFERGVAQATREGKAVDALGDPVISRIVENAAVARSLHNDLVRKNETSASTEETSASTQQIAGSAQQLATSAAELQRLVGRFRPAA